MIFKASQLVATADPKVGGTILWHMGDVLNTLPPVQADDVAAKIGNVVPHQMLSLLWLRVMSHLVKYIIVIHFTILSAVLYIPLATGVARADVAYSWGINDAGELGNGTYSGRSPFGAQPTPQPINILSDMVTAVDAGGRSSFAIQNGAAFAWGWGGQGQLGYSTASGYVVNPMAIPGLSTGVTAIASGYSHTLVIKSGAVYAFGDGQDGDISLWGTQYTAVPGLATGATTIAAGRYYSLAIQGGGVYAWGANWHGQLGNGTAAASTLPVPVTGLLTGVTAIVAGGSTVGVTNNQPDGTWYSHCLAIKSGAVYSWGTNNSGQLGNGTLTSSLVPVAVTGLTSGVTNIAAGDGFSLAVKSGNVYAWGYNGVGELGDGSTTNQLTPELIDPSDLKSIVSVAATAGSSYALSSDGSLWDWGQNYSEELGLGANASVDYLTPQHLLPPAGYVFTSVSGQGDGTFLLATLAPVPEPASLSILTLTGLAVLGSRKRRAPSKSNRRQVMSLSDH